MTKSDILELRKRFKKDCTISRITGCYVNCNKETVVKLNETFLNLEEEEFYKYLDIAKKTMSGAVGNNILELSFPSAEEEAGGRQKFLLGLRESNLQNEELLDRLYEQIIENYDYPGNYLILVYHDSYDIMTRTNDNLKLDESEEVYDYVLISICPVELSKPGLGYRADENRIGARVRDWVVGAPDVGFLFPAFSDHSGDIHKLDYFVRDARDSRADFVEKLMGCRTKHTATEQREAFKSIVKHAYRDDEEKADDVFLNIQETFESRLEPDEDGAEPEPVAFDEAVISQILEESGVKDDPARVIKDICKEQFAQDVPNVDDLLDTKLLKANEHVRREKELVKEVLDLKEKLKTAEKGGKPENQNSDGAEAFSDGAKSAETFGEGFINIKVSPEKAEQIRSEVIGDKRYIMIPLEDDDLTVVNGQESEV